MVVETSFGHWLQRRRKALDLTQEELARRVGCATETLRKIEADVRRPSRQMAERLAEALDIPEADRTAFIRAARAELAVDRLTPPTQDIPQVTLVPAKTLSSEAVTFLFTQITSTFQTKPFDGRCPYKGLDVFEEEDAELFFGRERLVEDLLSRVKESRTVFIIGPSGSGKSSLIRAGLIPALKQGAIQSLHSERWLYETMNPGRDPIGELARVISSMAGTTNAGDELREHAAVDQGILAEWCEIALKEGRDKRVILFVDQFEEIFTQVSNEEERLSFLNLLTHAATIENGRTIILFAMRSDFVLNCATYPQLNTLFNLQSVQIGSMQPDELVSAIAQPALRVGLRIDPDLVAQIINDMQGEPGALPLMQFALKDLFDSQQAKGGMIDLTLNDYLQHGGIHKSLERHADDSFTKLDDSEQELARSIFSSLIEIGRGTQDTRRTALFDELIPADSKADEVQAVIHKLADARLITTDEQAGKDTVTISHEKLIDAWPWLKKLVNENREAIALQNEIASDAQEWYDHKRDPSYLYTGARLANARQQVEIKKLVLSGTAYEFVQAGINAFNDEKEAINREEARKKRLQKRIIVGLIGFTAIILVLLVFALIQLDVSRALQLSAQAQAAFADENYNAAALYAYQSNLRHENEVAKEVLGNVHYQNFALGKGLMGHTMRILNVAWSADGHLASSSEDTTVNIWDLSTGRPVQTLRGHTDVVSSVAWSGDGRLASGSWDNTVIIWDLSTGQPAQTLQGYTEGVLDVAWSEDGRLASGSGDNTVIIWDLSTGQPAQTLKGHTSGVTSLAWSADGRLATASYDATVIIWDLSTGQPAQTLKGHTSGVTSLAWSADGRLVSASYDTTVIIWDLSTGQPAQTLQGHMDYVTSVAWSADGRLVSASYDNTIIIWDLSTGRPAQTLKGHTDWVFSVAWSEDGRLASGSGDKTVIIWDLSIDHPAQTLQGYTDYVTNLAWSPDGRLASGSLDNTIIIWDLATGQPAQIFKRHKAGITSLAWSEDDRLASGSDDNTIIIWDLATGPPAQILQGHTSVVYSVAWSPDGRLASGSVDNTIIIWDLSTGQPTQTLQALYGFITGITSVAWSGDGQLASGSADNSVIIWDLSTGQPAQTLKGHTDYVTTITWSGDGRLASSSYDNSVIIWDLSTGQPVQTLMGHTDQVTTVSWSTDGRLASGSYDKTVKIARADIIRGKSCDWIYRNMTVDEWLAFQGIAYIYHPACPNLSFPIFPSTNNIVSRIQARDYETFMLRIYDFSKLAFITWKGRIIIFVLFAILVGIVWVLYRLISWVRQRIYKRFRNEPGIV